MATSFSDDGIDDPGRIDSEPERATGGNAMATVVISAGVIAGLYFGSVILEPLALAVLLSLMLAPLVRLLRLYIGRVPAALTSVVLAFLVILGVAASVGDEAFTLAQNLPKYEYNIAAKIRSLNGVPGGGIIGRATRVFQDLSAELSASTTPQSGEEGSSKPVPVEIKQPSAPLQLLRDVVGPMLPPLAAAGLVGLFTILILLQREDLRARLLRLAGVGDLERTTAAMNEAAERVSRYLLMQLAVGIGYGATIGISLAAIGIPNAPLWAVVAIITRFIPYIGGPLTAVLPCLLAIAVDPGWGKFFWTVALFAGAETFTANVAEPWIYARSTGLSAVAIVAAAAFWTWLWGMVGLLLATPLTVFLVVLGRYVPHLQFLDVLLGSGSVLTPQERFYQRLLARDPEEATEEAEAYAREHSLDAFLDEVAIPALAMAQADADRGVLPAPRRAAIAAGLATVLDNLAEDGQADEEPAGEPIVCLAGRNELDLAAAWALQHLLRRRGHAVAVFSPDALASFNLDRLPLRDAPVLCLSLLKTGSSARVRYLLRRVRRRARHPRLVVGFWGEDRAALVDADSTITAIADAVVTSLADAVAEIEAGESAPAATPARQTA